MKLLSIRIRIGSARDVMMTSSRFYVLLQDIIIEIEAKTNVETRDESQTTMNVIGKRNESDSLKYYTRGQTSTVLT